MLTQPVYRRYLGNTDEMWTIGLEILVLGGGGVGEWEGEGEGGMKKNEWNKSGLKDGLSQPIG